MLSPAENAQGIAKEMVRKAMMPFTSIAILSIMGGGAIAMGDIFWAHSTIGVAENQSIGLANFIGGLTFACGLMLVVFFGGHLFTSSVLSGVSAYDKRLTWGKALNYWVIVWIFNFVGAILIAYMYYYSGLPLKFDGYILWNFIPISVAKVTSPFHELFIRAIFCNIFVCMAVWSASAQSDIAGKFFCILWMIAAFVACSMEHCVANMFIITQGLIGKAHYLSQFSGDLNELTHVLNMSVEQLNALNIGSFLVKNLIPVTLGNIVGGFIFVGLMGFIAHKCDMKKD